jgi:NAD(P)-dependent dehydrogenase (short-subunit alcohol dehydrogenase family)
MRKKTVILPEHFNLTGKTALITGGAGLLGEQHARALLGINADIVLTDINVKNLCDLTKLLKKTYPKQKILNVYMDVSQKKDILNTAKFLSKKRIRIDILINNAALDPKVRSGQTNLNSGSRLENYSLESWNREVAVGLTGAFLCSQIFGSAMAKDGKGGVILNISSDLSKIAPDQRIYRKRGIPEKNQPVKPVTYSVIKTGLIGLTRYLATYWAHRTVRVNALSPGGVFLKQPKAFTKKIQKLIPLGRMAQISEYKGAVQFLCSDASKYINGQNIIIDGGRSIW